MFHLDQRERSEPTWCNQDQNESNLILFSTHLSKAHIYGLHLFKKSPRIQWSLGLCNHTVLKKMIHTLTSDGQDVLDKVNSNPNYQPQLTRMCVCGGGDGEEEAGNVVLSLKEVSIYFLLAAFLFCATSQLCIFSQLWKPKIPWKRPFLRRFQPGPSQELLKSLSWVLFLGKWQPSFSARDLVKHPDLRMLAHH